MCQVNTKWQSSAKVSTEHGPHATGPQLRVAATGKRVGKGPSPTPGLMAGGGKWNGGVYGMHTVRPGNGSKSCLLNDRGGHR